MSEEDARELSVWGPSHDSLLEEQGHCVSVNFHFLSSGRAAISRTTLAGQEYSGRTGQRVHTHFLVVHSEALQRFSNNPFSIVRAAVAQGALEVSSHVPRELPALRLLGRGAILDPSAVQKVATQVGAKALASLVQMIQQGANLGIILKGNAAPLFTAIVNCLPLKDRLQVSFSTGLRISPRRPFQFMLVPPEASPRRTHLRGMNMELVNLADQAATSFPPLTGWGQELFECLQAPSLGDLEARLKGEDERPIDPVPDIRSRVTSREPRGFDAATEADKHRGGVALANAATMAEAAEEPPAILPIRSFSNLLEERSVTEPLDACVSDAMTEGGEALRRLKAIWHHLHREFGADVIDPVRAKYVGDIVQVWKTYLASPNSDATRAGYALEVLEILFESPGSE